MTGAGKNKTQTKGGCLTKGKSTIIRVLDGTVKTAKTPPQKEIATARRGDNAPKREDSAPRRENTETMQEVILTNEHSGVSNSNAHRVAADEELRLFTAAEAARILHVSRNVIYALWRDGELDFWRINGTMTTNLTAIRDYLERMRNGGCD